MADCLPLFMRLLPRIVCGTLFLCRASLGAQAASPPENLRPWLEKLIEDVRSLNALPAATRQHADRVASIKSRFAISDMAKKSYGAPFQSLSAAHQRAYVDLMDQFFEKAVIYAVLKSKFKDSRAVTYRIFAPKALEDSECAVAVMGPIEFENRVDWTLQTQQGSERYETRFCLNTTNHKNFRVFDMVIEGISWVDDVAAELSEFLNPPKSAAAGPPPPLSERHEKLMARIRDRIKKLDAPDTKAKDRP